MRARAGECVCHAVFSKTITKTIIFCQRVLMNLHALEYFLGFIDFEEKLSEL